MVYWGIVIAVLLADQLSKLAVMGSLSLFETIPVIPGFFNLTFVVNRGAAFSLLAQADASWRHPFFLTVGVVAVTALTIYYFRTCKDEPRQALGLPLIAGGALGNLIDRLRMGGVVDFLDFHYAGYHWPAFNIADSAICIGVGVYLLFSFSDSGRKSKYQR